MIAMGRLIRVIGLTIQCGDVIPVHHKAFEISLFEPNGDNHKPVLNVKYIDNIFKNINLNQAPDRR